MNIENFEKFDKYGTLITVVSLLFVVVYATEGYDLWDTLIAIICFSFGIKYLKEKAFFDNTSIYLAMLITISSLIIILISLSYIFGFGGIFEPIKLGNNRPIDYVPVIIIFLTFIFGKIISKN